MTPLLDLIERYGQAMADIHDESKTYTVRVASQGLAEQLLGLIKARLEAVEDL